MLCFVFFIKFLRYALKLLDIGSSARFGDEEVSLMKKLSNHNHSNILKYFEDFVYSGFHCIVTEYCEEGDLKQLLKSFKNKNENERRVSLNANKRLEWSRELFDGLSFIHGEKVVHLDLKPPNVYLFKNKFKNNQLSIKIGDFGCSKEKLQSDLKSFVGTLYYQSPQIVRNESYSFKTDVW